MQHNVRTYYMTRIFSFFANVILQSRWLLLVITKKLFHKAFASLERLFGYKQAAASAFDDKFARKMHFMCKLHSCMILLPVGYTTNTAAIVTQRLSCLCANKSLVGKLSWWVCAVTCKPSTSHILNWNKPLLKTKEYQVLVRWLKSDYAHCLTHPPSRVTVHMYRTLLGTVSRLLKWFSSSTTWVHYHNLLHWWSPLVNKRILKNFTH